MSGHYWVETLGCPKNQVDSHKLEGRLAAAGMSPAGHLGDADLVVVNTCAFIEDARKESIETILAVSGDRKDGARLVVTGCLAERYHDELSEALPEVDEIVGFGVPFGPIALADGAGRPQTRFDLLDLPRPTSRRPWAYVKVAEGCDRECGFCAIPMIRGPQRSRALASVLEEVDALSVREVVLVAQDLARYGMDRTRPEAECSRDVVSLVNAVRDRVARVRLMYLHPSELRGDLVDAICSTGVPYFDLSLQHVSRPHLIRMRRWGDGRRFLDRIEEIRRREPDAAFRSNFIVGYPGETEEDHDLLLAFLEEARLDWAGFFAYSPEEGTHAGSLPGRVPAELAIERIGEASQLQDRITAERRVGLIGRQVQVLVDERGIGRTYREAPEIDGVVHVPDSLTVGTFAWVTVRAAVGTDVEAD